MEISCLIVYHLHIDLCVYHYSPLFDKVPFVQFIQPDHSLQSLSQIGGLSQTEVEPHHIQLSLLPALCPLREWCGLTAPNYSTETSDGLVDKL